MNTRTGLYLALAAVLAGCGGKADTTTQEQAAAKVRVDQMQATLQQKADALARQASQSPPPAAGGKNK
jgi:hypothetical protein